MEDKIRQVLSLEDKHIEQDKQESKVKEVPKPIDSDQLRAKVKELNSRLEKMDKIERKQVKQLQEDYLPRLEKYEDQLENYEFMEDNRMEAYVKYNYFHKEQKRA